MRAMRWILSSIFLLHLLREPVVSAQNAPEGFFESSDTDALPYNVHPTGALTGELRRWHKITIGFEAFNTTERNTTQNPFTDLRLDVTFTHAPSVYIVPGYYAADGNAANSGADSGPVWLVHFAPDEVGTWEWEASFVKGENVALKGGGTSASFFDGVTGTFTVDPTDKTGRDHRGKGRLQYVGEHHLRFAESGEWFLKAGADSPENFLEYEDFDNTPNIRGNLKSWAPHQQDSEYGDPTWRGGKGSEIVGALNYLSKEGMNAFSFIPLTIDGDAKSVYPYISDDAADRLRMDCSKLAQWEIVFEHADRKGLFLHFKTQETENDQLLDGGALGIERKLYYREFIARFGHHLALNWNLGEENTNTAQQRQEFSEYIKTVDPYSHPVVSHSVSTEKEATYSPLLGLSTFDGASLNGEPDDVFDTTLEWVQRSASAGHKWIVSSDEQSPPSQGVAPDSMDPLHDSIRQNVLWGNIMAGGAGVEFYFGGDLPCSDLTCQDYRSRANLWRQSRWALWFFSEHSIPFWDMANDNDRVTNDNWCLADPNDNMLVVYLKSGSATIDLSHSGAVGVSYLVDWFDPRNGGPLQKGTVKLLSAGKVQSLGDAPTNREQDWVVLLSKCSDCHSTHDEGGLGAGVIAGLVIACFVALAFALLYVRNFRKQSMPSEKVSDEGSQNHNESGNKTPQDPPTTNPASGTIHGIPVVTGTSDSSAVSPVTANDSEEPTQLPVYKDQVRNVRNPSVAQVSIPTVEGVQVNHDSTETNPPETFRVEV